MKAYVIVELRENQYGPYWAPSSTLEYSRANAELRAGYGFLRAGLAIIAEVELPDPNQGRADEVQAELSAILAETHSRD